MARPQTASDDDILNAAQLVLNRRGPDGFTASEVAREVNLSRTAIVLRFASTDALKSAVLDRQLKAFRQKLAALHIQQGKAGLLTIADFIASMISSRDSMANFLLRRKSDGPNQQQRAMERERGRMLRAAIDRALPGSVADRADIMNAFMAHVTGTLIAWQFDETADARSFMAARTEIWLKLMRMAA